MTSPTTSDTTYQQVVQVIQEALTNLGVIDVETLQAAGIDEGALSGVNVQQAIVDACEYPGVPPAAKAALAPSHPVGYTAPPPPPPPTTYQELIQQVSVVNNYVDNSVDASTHIDGDIHGDFMIDNDVTQIEGDENVVGDANPVANIDASGGDGGPAVGGDGGSATSAEATSGDATQDNSGGDGGAGGDGTGGPGGTADGGRGGDDGFALGAPERFELLDAERALILPVASDDDGGAGGTGGPGGPGTGGPGGDGGSADDNFNESFAESFASADGGDAFSEGGDGGSVGPITFGEINFEKGPGDLDLPDEVPAP